jgi:hypothetical protein
MSNYGPKVAWSQISEGVRLYYTGDMANHSGFGTVSKAWFDPKWGYHNIEVTMDDGRPNFCIELSGLQPGPGRHFWLASDYEADRQQRIAEAQAQWAHLKRA